jgi:hypothetical protein
MSLIELKKQKEKTVFVTVDKASQESTIGLTLNYYDGGRVLVRGVADEGVFAGSELTAGLLLNSVNDTPVKGMSTAQVMELFTQRAERVGRRYWTQGGQYV